MVTGGGDMEKKRRGLGSLIPDMDWGTQQAQAGPMTVPVEALAPGPYQPRQDWDPEKLEELARSIKEQGVLQPLLVRRRDDAWQVLAGWRRWQAAKMAGLAQVPVVVRECDDREALEIALVENLQREDINPLDAGEAYRVLKDSFAMTEDQIAARVGSSRSSVANRLRLLQLPEEIQRGLRANRITEGHARALLAVGSEGVMVGIYQAIVRRGLSVRQTERMVRAVTGQLRTRKAEAVDPNLVAFQESLQRALGTRVSVRARGSGGAIVIEYYSAEELDRIASQILGTSPGS
jgi:ParB family chromosome partitioning protein